MNRATIQMNRGPATLRYYIGEHDGLEYPFDRNTYRAYFYWREGDCPRTQSFSVEQLEEHIAECKCDRLPTHKFELALDRLRRMNAPAAGT